MKDRRIILIAGCLYNPHCRVHVLGKNFPLAHELGAYLTNHQVGVIAYHCPEFTLGGFNRNPQGRIQYDNMFFRAHCQDILKIPMQMIQEFINNKYRLVAVIGLQNSPSCCVNWKAHKTNKRNEESWMECTSCEQVDIKTGVMMEEIQSQLNSMKVNTTYIEFPLSSPIGSSEHKDFWYDLRRAIEPANPYLTYENAEEFRATFFKTNHRNDPNVEFKEMRKSKLRKNSSK